MSAEEFSHLLSGIAARLDGRAARRPDGGVSQHRVSGRRPRFPASRRALRRGRARRLADGREAGGIQFGRAIKPGGATGGFSVDVVRMKDVKGPHHMHPNGEIGAVIPIAGTP